MKGKMPGLMQSILELIESPVDKKFIRVEIKRRTAIIRTIEQCVERKGLGWCYKHRCKNRKSCIVYINGGSILNLLDSEIAKKVRKRD